MARWRYWLIRFWQGVYWCRIAALAIAAPIWFVLIGERIGFRPLIAILLMAVIGPHLYTRAASGQSSGRAAP